MSAKKCYLLTLNDFSKQLEALNSMLPVAVSG